MHGKDWEGAVAQASASDTGAEGGIGSEPGLVALATAGLLCYVMYYDKSYREQRSAYSWVLHELFHS